MLKNKAYLGVLNIFLSFSLLPLPPMATLFPPPNEVIPPVAASQSPDLYRTTVRWDSPSRLTELRSSAKEVLESRYTFEYLFFGFSK